MPKNLIYSTIIRRRLQILLTSLKTRRLDDDVMFVYKLLNGDIDCPEILQKIGLKVPSFNSRHNPPYAIPHSKKKKILH